MQIGSSMQGGCRLPTSVATSQPTYTSTASLSPVKSLDAGRATGSQAYSVQAARRPQDVVSFGNSSQSQMFPSSAAQQQGYYPSSGVMPSYTPGAATSSSMRYGASSGASQYPMGTYTLGAVPGTASSVPVPNGSVRSVPNGSLRSTGAPTSSRGSGVLVESFLPSPNKKFSASSAGPVSVPASSLYSYRQEAFPSDLPRPPPTSNISGASGGSPADPVLEVRILSASNLRKADLWGKSDPYCILEIIGKPGSKTKTKVIKKNLYPKWDEAFVLKDFEAYDSLKFTVMDHDFGKKDDFLGEVILPNAEFYPNGLELVDLLLDQKSVKYETAEVKVEKEGRLGIEIDAGSRGGVVVKDIEKDSIIAKLSKGKVVQGMLLRDVGGQEITSLDQACDLLADRPCKLTFQAYPTIQVQVTVLNKPVQPPPQQQRPPASGYARPHLAAHEERLPPPTRPMPSQPQRPPITEPFQVPASGPLQQSGVSEAFDLANSIPSSTGSARWHAHPPTSYPRVPLDSSRVSSVEFGVRPPQRLDAPSAVFGSGLTPSTYSVRVHVGQAAGLEGGPPRYVTCELLDKPESLVQTEPQDLCDWNEAILVPGFVQGDILKVSIFQQEAYPQQDILLAVGDLASEDFFPGGLSAALDLQPAQADVETARVGLGIDVLPAEQPAGPCGSSSMCQAITGQPPIDMGPKRISVLIMRAQGLQSEIQTKIDAYCVFEILGKAHTQFATPVASQNQSPAWHEEHEIEDYTHGDSLRFLVLNKAGPDPALADHSFVDSMAEDDEILGEVRLDSQHFDPFGLNAWLPLCRPSRRYSGLLRVRVCIIESPFRPNTTSVTATSMWGASQWHPGMDAYPGP
mmetsp:Transcript_35405/g.64839  ORF Transcript_35405/g.64839 Transcript_35405/m.64839 type:complete len:855 (-) Transcript_35405:21-2585(-)